MSESSYSWVRRQAHDRYFTYQIQAKDTMRWDVRDVARARLILPRVAELRAQGLELVDAIRVAEKEHPVDLRR